MVDYSRPRNDSWSFHLLDSRDQPLGALDGVNGGSVEVAALTRLGADGSLSIDATDQAVDWLGHRVQVVYDPGLADADPWPVATMLFTSPKASYDDFGVTYDVTLLSKLSIVDEDALEEATSYAEGTDIIAAVVELIWSTGETRIAVTGSGSTLRSAQVFEAGESKLTVINKLLDAAGYWSLRCDGSGQFRVEPYVDTASRPTAYVFGADEVEMLVVPEWEHEQDLSSVPNRFIVIGEGTDEEPPLVGVALNEDPDSPFSFQSRGRWITRKEEGVEGADQAVFNQLAQRRLLDAMTPVSRLAVSHVIVPLEPNDRVAFNPLRADSRDATVLNIVYDFGEGPDCTAVWREI